MLTLILLWPFLGFLSGGLLGRRMGKFVCVTTTVNVFLSLFCSSSLLFEILLTGVVYKVDVGSWVVADSLTTHWCLCFDSLTAIMLVVVTTISTLVHLYSTEYMESDPHLPRFMSYLSLFTFFMLILITASNFLQMFVGWEGVGLSSYLLINFWFTRIQANKAAIKAMLVNRIGDFALLLAIFTIYFSFGSLDYDVVFGLATLTVTDRVLIGNTEVCVVSVSCALLFLGAMGKSAQLGLHTWLPDAMEGPTPVSALIHAATMVTAGVFLLVRCSFLFEFADTVLIGVTYIGSCTAFFAATTGLFQNDIKKVIAYSTCSQLGYMFFACGLSSYEVGVFHLSNHAFFKALLFLGAGSIIHAVADEQDMRKMGGLQQILPFSYCAIMIGSVALMGFPFLAGFYSKDAILEVAYAKYTTAGHFAYILGILAAFCTAFYSVRLLFLVFLAKPNGNRSTTINAHEASWKMGFPLLLLSIFSLFVGFCTRDFFIGFGTSFWGSSIFVLPQNYAILDTEFIPLGYKFLPLVVSTCGALSAFFMYLLGLPSFLVLKKSPVFYRSYTFLNRKWYFDRINNELFGQSFLNFGHSFTYQNVDRGIIEKLGPSGFLETFGYIFDFLLKRTQSGYLFHYLLVFFLSAIVLLLFVLFFSTVSFSLTALLFLIANMFWGV